MAKSNIKQKHEKGLLGTIIGQHPYKTFLYLLVLGITLLFVVCIIAFQVTKQPFVAITHFQFPKAFVVSTFVLMLSSIVLGDVLVLYESDQIVAIRNKLITALLLGFVFMISQFYGWMELVTNGVLLQGNASNAYLYVISGLHLFHLLGGIGFMFVETIKVGGKSKDGVKSLIYFTDPFQKLKLELLRTYWNFMDILWVAIFFYFLFSF